MPVVYMHRVDLPRCLDRMIRIGPVDIELLVNSHCTYEKAKCEAADQHNPPPNGQGLKRSVIVDSIVQRHVTAPGYSLQTIDE